MEKNHRFANQSLSKGQTSDSKKNQDISTKWPRNSKRREQTNSSGYKPENLRTTSSKATPAGKSRAQTNFNYDKRSKQRPEAAAPLFPEASASALDTTNPYDDHYEGTGLASHDGSDFGTGRHELHSVFSPGSKKQSLNHLLNFHYTPRERDQPIRFCKTGNNRSYVKKVTYNKEQYLQANCQFVVRAGEDYIPVLASPDNLVDWAKIEQVHIFSSEEPQCPICLYPPVAAKMTKCGHIYCWPCILHYLALSDKAWRKCPICYDAIHVPDLRSCVLKPFHSYTVGETVTFQLMRREKSLLIAEIASEVGRKSFDVPLFNPSLGRTILTKLLLAGPAEILAIIEREQQELENQIVVDGIDCPENIFVQQALEQLKDRREKAQHVREVPTAVKQENARMSESSSEEASGFSIEGITECAQEEETTAIDQSTCAIDFMIDEDNNFTLSDIDIVPTSTCASSDYFYFYQSADGQPLYLHSMNTRMLQAMYGGLDKSPQIITGKIVHKDSSSMSEALRKRLKYLQHLPICTQFEVVEIEFKQGVISPEVLAQFKDEINGRRKDRQKRARAERIRERQIFEFNERQLGKSLARSAKINIDSNKHFPTCGNESFDFSHEPSLCTSPSVSDASASPCPSGPSWSKMLSTSPAASRWPSLPSGGSVNVFGPLAAPPPKMIQVTGSKMSSATASLNKHRFTSESDAEDYDDIQEARAPEPRNNLASAIEAALEKVSLNNELAVLEAGGIQKQKGSAVPNNGGTKKKKNKKTVLFASGMNLN